MTLSQLLAKIENQPLNSIPADLMESVKFLLGKGLLYDSDYGVRLVIGRGNTDKTHLPLESFI